MWHRLRPANLSAAKYARHAGKQRWTGNLAYGNAPRTGFPRVTERTAKQALVYTSAHDTPRPQHRCAQIAALAIRTGRTGFFPAAAPTRHRPRQRMAKAAVHGSGQGRCIRRGADRAATAAGPTTQTETKTQTKTAPGPGKIRTAASSGRSSSRTTRRCSDRCRRIVCEHARY